MTRSKGYLALAGAIVGLLLLPPAVQAIPIYTYVGSYEVDDGPNWTLVPTAYSGVDAAALLLVVFLRTTQRPSIQTRLTRQRSLSPPGHSTWGGACGGNFPCGTAYAQNYADNTLGLYQTARRRFRLRARLGRRVGLHKLCLAGR